VSPTTENERAPGLCPEAQAPTTGDESKVAKSSEQSSLARALRDTALDRIAMRVDPEWMASAEAALLRAIDMNGTACVDDCRQWVPVPRLARWWCVVPRRLVARGLIERVGSCPGHALVTHGGDLRLWARKVAQ